MHYDALIDELPKLDDAAASEIQSIFVMHGPASLPALMRALDRHETREAALGILVRMPRGLAIPAISGLVRIARENGSAASRLAVQVLGAIGTDAIPALIDVLETAGDTYEVCGQLIRLGERASVIAAVGSRFAPTRLSAARALKVSGITDRGDAFELLKIASRAEAAGRSMAADVFRSVVPVVTQRVDILLEAARNLSLEIGRKELSVILDENEALSVLAVAVRTGAPDSRLHARKLLARILPNFRDVVLPGTRSDKELALPFEVLSPETLNWLAEQQPERLRALSRSLIADRTGRHRLYLTGPPEPELLDIQELGYAIREHQNALAFAEDSLRYEEPISPERTRYTDVAIYKGDLFAGDDLPAENKLDDASAVIEGEAYTLEVAIRAQRTGIESGADAPHGVVNPRVDREPLTVYVLVSSQAADLDFPDPLVKIAWPYDEDSESALLRFTPTRRGTSGTDARTIDIRLYDASLDLLDIVRLRIEVRQAGDTRTTKSKKKINRLVWPDKSFTVPEADTTPVPRVMSINVQKVSAGYRFEFLVLGKDGKVSIPIWRDIGSGDLDALLLKVRNFWTELVIGTYADSLSVSRVGYARNLTELARLGTEAWSLVFGARYGSQAASPEALGELVKGLDFAEGSTIQITCGPAAGNFIFPWNILYAPPVVPDNVDPLAFWGARYQIEQVRQGRKEDSLKDETVNVLFGLDPGFGESATQQALWKRYNTTSGGRINVSTPASDQASFLRELTSSPSPHFVYLFCHGYAAAPPGNLRQDGVRLLKQRIEDLDPDSPVRRTFETLLTLTAKMGDESWIYLGDSEIKESQLKYEQFFQKRRPIVFLNMCQSAELLPSMSSGITRVFLDHDATAVIGTESPMTASFASEFARILLDSLLGGSTIGAALYSARRHFLSNEFRNPLGLAYTLYGRATVTLGTRPLIDFTPQTNTLGERS